MPAPAAARYVFAATSNNASVLETEMAAVVHDVIHELKEERISEADATSAADATSEVGAASAVSEVKEVKETAAGRETPDSGTGMMVFDTKVRGKARI